MLFFRQSRGKQDLQKQILGIINRTGTSLRRTSEQRASRRFLRAVPVALAPWDKSAPVPDDHAFAVTRDISVGGMGLILQQPFRSESIVIAIRPTPIEHHEPLGPPRFFVGSVSVNAAIGGGFWLLGVDLIESVSVDDSQEFRKFQEIAMRLTPPVVDQKQRSIQSRLN